MSFRTDELLASIHIAVSTWRWSCYVRIAELTQILYQLTYKFESERRRARFNSCLEPVFRLILADFGQVFILRRVRRRAPWCREFLPHRVRRWRQWAFAIDGQTRFGVEDPQAAWLERTGVLRPRLQDGLSLGFC